MALTTEELIQVRDFLAANGINCDTQQSAPVSTDKLPVLKADGTGGYVNYSDILNAVVKSGTVANALAKKVDNTALTEALKTKLDKVGGTLTGQLTSQKIIPSANDTYDLGSSNLEFLNGYIKYLSVQYIKLGGKECNIVGLHNGLYRGACLYDAINGAAGVFSSIAAIHTAVSAGNFDDIYIGDYIDIKISTTYTSNESVRMVVAGIDSYLHRGYPTETTAHHLVLVPEDCFAATAQMNSSDTTDGGYVGSAMYKTVLPAYATALNSALGGYLLSTCHLFCTKVNASAVAPNAGGGWTGAANGWGWQTTNIALLTEIQVYGSAVWGTGFTTGDACQQLPYFALRPDKMVAYLGYQSNSRCNWWLSAVAGSAYFALVDGNGGAVYLYASYSSGVRPRVLFG